MDYPDDLNCSIVAADWHGPMTLDEISKRLKISLVMVGHIEQKALVKLRKKNQDLKDVLHE
jgi:DNA-directed RNA polymerase sigma subunit (sigma70/sigma32)